MSVRSLVAALALTVLLAGSASGGILLDNPHAWYDPSIGASWTGSTVLDNGTLTGTVEWAVFGPGHYPGGGYTPDPNEFVYAYQIFSSGSAPVTQITVDMIEANKAVNIADDPVYGPGTAPWGGWFGAPPPELQTANWGFDGLSAGDHSDILVYSSVNMPVWDYLAYIVDDGTSAMGDVPTPSNFIPEPATVGLLVLGAAIGWMKRRRR